MKSTTTSTALRHRKIARSAVVLAMALLLGACNGMNRSDFDSLVQIGTNLMADDPGVTLKQAAAVPYASIGVRIGGGRESMLILASETGEQHLWTSAQKIAITTRNGRIVTTAGLENNLGALYSVEASTPKGEGATEKFTMDFPELGVYGVIVSCVDKRASEETIKILGQDIKTKRIESACKSQSRELSWTFENTYWTDPENGFLWRSIQHVNPQLAPVEIEVLRPQE